MIDSRESAEALRQSFHFDHRLRHKDESGKREGGSARRGEPMARARDNALGTTRSTFPAFLI
jgi:hypothetical protein